MQHLNLNHLFYFYTIATEGSIRDACSKLSLTQSTLSNQLKELEQYFGESLFDRKGKGLILNETGKKVLTYASEIFKLRTELTLSVKNHYVERVHMIRVGFIPGLTKGDTYPILSTLWGHNQMVLKTKQDSLSNLLIALEANKIDVIFSDRPIVHESFTLKNRELLKKHLVFLGHKKFRTLAHNFPRSLSTVPFCAYSEDSKSQAELNKYFETNMISPNIVGELDDMFLLKLAAEEGKCLVALPLDFAKDSIMKGQLFEIGAPLELHTSIWMITLGDSKFSNYFQQCFEETMDNKIIERS